MAAHGWFNIWNTIYGRMILSPNFKILNCCFNFKTQIKRIRLHTNAVRVAKVAAKRPAPHANPSAIASPISTNRPLKVLLAKTTWENPRRIASKILNGNQPIVFGLIASQRRTSRFSPSNSNAGLELIHSSKLTVSWKKMRNFSQSD